MKMVAEYLEKAHQFERFAASEQDPNLKAELLAQAEAYRKLAAERAKNKGLPFPHHAAPAGGGSGSERV